MKKVARLGMLSLAMAAMMEQPEMYEEIDRPSKPIEPKPKKITPFKKEDGVVKMIKEYNLIKTGKSKKGVLKQTRIKNKVDDWLKSGMLKEYDLSQLG